MVPSAAHALILASACAAATSAPARDSALLRYREKIEAKQFLEALLELRAARQGTHGPGDADAIDIMLEEAHFHRAYARDLRRAIRILDKAHEAAQETAPHRVAAIVSERNEARRLLHRYRADEQYVQEFLALPREQQAERVGEVRARLRHTEADSPFYAALHHCLGVAYLATKQEREAYSAFHQARQIAPAVDLVHPTQALMDRTFERWSASAAQALKTVGLLAAAAAVLLALVVSRAHFWLRWVHLLPLPGLAIVWFAAHRGLAALSERLADTTPPAESGFVVHTRLGTPLSEPLGMQLFCYGLMALVAIYVVSLGALRIRLPATRIAVGCAVAGFIMAVAMVAFTVENVRNPVVPHANASFPRMWGSFQFIAADPIGYMLSDPAAYPRFEMDDFDETVPREYYRRFQAHKAPQGD